MKPKNEVILYKTKDGPILKVNFQDETVWLTQLQMSELFGVERSVTTKHIGNVFKTFELQEKSNVQKVHIPNSDKPIKIYSLDVVLSVGYRVNSKEATSFRIWANSVLKDYLLKGFAVNKNSIENSQAKLKELEGAVSLIQNAIKNKQLSQDETAGLLSVIADYAQSWVLLQKYDESGLVMQKSKTKEVRKFEYEFVRPSIDKLKDVLIKKGEASNLFGNERDGSFAGILKTVYQTFAGKELYASLEEKAAHLLYFIIKDHPFSDGNKRIGAFSFVLFLQENKILFRKNSERKINDNALVALALLIAQSKPGEKDQMIALVTQLLA
ncbi:MAG: virulence protein RhuM/Fic/DOC family protein [bacterium]